MFAFTAYPRLPHRALSTRGNSVRRIMCRIGAAACVTACAPAAAGQASAATTARAEGAVQAAVTVRAATAAGRTRAYSRTIVVTNRADSGAGSLRAAIKVADTRPPGISTLIKFAVAGTVTLASRLPAISRKVTINATSAPGHVSGGPPVLEIDCHARAGLHFAAGSRGSQLLGVAVDNASGDGVRLNAGSITLNDDYIGLDLRGRAAGNHGDGVYVSAKSRKNFIGLNHSGASGAVANVISGNSGSGIVLAGSSGNTVVANRIGTNAAGNSRIANGGDGITITRRSDGNEIGGTEFTDTATGETNNPTGSKGTVSPVFVVPPLGNLISGNARNGVLIDSGSRDNMLNGNFVGTTAHGDAAIGNAGDGVWIKRAATTR